MKALILAGGHGTRLRPLTHTQSKQLLPIANTPILFYGLSAVARTPITEVGIIVGDTEEEIREAVGDGSRWGLSVTYVRQDAPLGLAHAVLTARDFLAGEPFLMYLGDNLVRQDLNEFIDVYERNGPTAQIFLVRVGEPEHFGVAILDGDRIRKLVEKPAEWISDWAMSGVYIFSPEIMSAVSHISPSLRGELEITDAVQWLIDHGYDVRASPITGWWKDTGKAEDLLDANTFVLEQLQGEVEGSVDHESSVSGEVQIGKGTTVTGSKINGPVIIGEGCTVRDSVLGPYVSIDDGTEVTGCEIERSIVMRECRLEDVALHDSLVGRNVRVRSSRSLRSQLMVGDNSTLIHG